MPIATGGPGGEDPEDNKKVKKEPTAKAAEKVVDLDKEEEIEMTPEMYAAK